LLDKFFGSQKNLAKAVSMIEKSGYQMEFKTDILQQIALDPF